MQKRLDWLCRVAPSLGEFEDSPENIWGTGYVHPILFFDGSYEDDPILFFGLYGMPDFYALWRHKGRKAILWAGSDIKHFINGYWIDDKGEIRWEPEGMALWINKNCENYVENGVEHEALMALGIESKIIPSFLGDIKDYKVEFDGMKEIPEVYLSVSGDNFVDYGWELIEMIADKCNVFFHLYGNTKEWKTKHWNVKVHGRVDKETMNEEIKKMQCGLRLNEFDGFSEILAKSVLWGQHPISRIGYPHIDSFKTPEELVKLLNNLVTKTSPNVKAREYYIQNLNAYIWNKNYKSS